MRLPIRARITAAFAGVIVVLLAGAGGVAYVSTGNALQDEIDTGLRLRAVSAERSVMPDAPAADRRLQERYEAFEQVLAADGTVVRSTPGFPDALLGPAEVARLSRPTFYSRNVRHVPTGARLLAVPLAGSRVLVVGASTSDRADALRRLLLVLVLGGAGAVLLACLAAWMVAGWALRPVERLRAEASAITTSGADRRLSVPATRDELHRLARTLNSMLDRVAGSVAGERAFLERAGHELRTPLSALRAEVDLALRHDRTKAELTDALHSVADETDHLARLADDLLVLARAADGRLPLRREPTQLRDALEGAAASLTARASEVDVDLVINADKATVTVDPARIRQLLVNLLDNAIRHTPPGGTVRLTGVSTPGEVRIGVADSGPGFVSNANSSGLGLRIAQAVAAAHGGRLHVGNGDDGGALVEVVLPARSAASR